MSACIESHLNPKRLRGLILHGDSGGIQLPPLPPSKMHLFLFNTNSFFYILKGLCMKNENQEEELPKFIFVEYRAIQKSY